MCVCVWVSERESHERKWYICDPVRAIEGNEWVCERDEAGGSISMEEMQAWRREKQRKVYTLCVWMWYDETCNNPSMISFFLSLPFFPLPSFSPSSFKNIIIWERSSLRRLNRFSTTWMTLFRKPDVNTFSRFHPMKRWPIDDEDQQLSVNQSREVRVSIPHHLFPHGCEIRKC